MADLVAADVTITPQKVVVYGSGRKRNLCKIAFGDSVKTYPSGGVPLPARANFGLPNALEYLVMLDRNDASDIDWKYDYSNTKLRGYQAGAVPLLVVEEAVTLTAHVGTLKYKPAYILAVTATIAAADAGLHVIPTGIAPATKEVAVTFTTGVITFFATDAASAVKVTYVPQQPAGFFSAANLVIDESVTLNSGTPVSTASRAGAFQYVYQTTATAARMKFGAAAASGVVVLDINNSGATKITVNAAQNTKVAKVTYLKHAGLADALQFVDQASISLTSQAFEWGVAGMAKGRILPGIGTSILGKETTNVLEIALGGPSITAAVALAKWDPYLQKVTTAESAGQTTIEEVSLLRLDPIMFPHRTVAELAAGVAAPPAQTLWVEAVGY